MVRIAMLQPRIATFDTALAPPPPKQTDPWYGTPEHKAWRKDVAERAGYICQDPQHKGPRVRCKGIGDHKDEIKDGGDRLDRANGIYRCWPCHTLKTNAVRSARQRGERTGGEGQKS